MDDVLTFPPRGHFGWQALVGPHQPDPRAMVEPTEFFGLTKVSQAAYGCLRDEDGAMYEVLRIFPSGSSSPAEVAQRAGFLLQSTAHHNDACLRIHPMSHGAAPSAGAAMGLEGGAAIWRSGDRVSGRPFELRCSGDAVSWSEEGVLDVTGELVGPGLHWYIPGLDVGMYWVSQLYQLRGTVLGRPVRGFIGIDEPYMPEGGIVEKKHDTLVGQRVHRTWYTFATRYRDGTLDGGHFIAGHDRAGFALLTDEKGEPHYTTDVKADISTREAWGHTWPASIRIDAGGDEWEFLPDGLGAMPDILGSGAMTTTAQHEGRWRRVGDDRDPEVWFAWGEIAPGNGLDHLDRYRY